MQKMSQTEELARLLAAVPAAYSDAGGDRPGDGPSQEYDAAGLDALHAALEAGA